MPRSRVERGARRGSLFRLLLVTACALLASGCVVTSSVVPVMYVSDASPDGSFSATSYAIEAAGKPAGEAKLWSRGAFREKVAGKARTLVHVGFSFTNDGEDALQLDEARLRLIDVVALTSNPYSVPAARVEGATRIAPGTTEQIDAYFTLPAATWPDDVRAFGVEWALEGDSQGVQRTAFVSTMHLRRPYVVYRNGHYWPHYSWPHGYVGPYPYWGPPLRHGWHVPRSSARNYRHPLRIYIRPRRPAP